MNNEIGGYFGLELSLCKEFHTEAIRLNSARNALEYVLRVKSFNKIYLPYFTCDVLIQPIDRLEIEYEFYFIDDSLEPIFDFNTIRDNEVFLYTNYFGLKDSFISKIKDICCNLIIDNAQAFYAKPLLGIDTFYSPRKFFGVPDGGYLYTNKLLEAHLDKDVSYNRFEHLLRRVDVSAEDGYRFFIQNDNSLNNAPVLQMSNLTKRILSSIDYAGAANKRRSNYLFLDSYLKKNNQLEFILGDNQVPLVYPFLTDNRTLKRKLIENKIFVATYWPNVLDWTSSDSVEYKLANNLIHLPVDQRYGVEELYKILEVIDS